MNIKNLKVIFKLYYYFKFFKFILKNNINKVYFFKNKIKSRFL